jgi:hypothetical protein
MSTKRKGVMTDCVITQAVAEEIRLLFDLSARKKDVEHGSNFSQILRSVVDCPPEKK